MARGLRAPRRFYVAPQIARSEHPESAGDPNTKSGSPDGCRELPLVLGRNVRICKPNSVCPHPGPCPTGGETIIYLGRPSPGASSGLPAPTVRRATLCTDGVGARCCLAFHLVGFAGPPLSPGTPVRSYRTLAPVTPTAPTVAGAGWSGQDCSLLHVPSCRRSRQSSEQTIRHAFPLGSAVPCGVRTFLTAAPARIGTGPDQAGTTERWPDPHATCLYRAGGKRFEFGSGTGAHAKKRSGLDRRLRFYRSRVSFISSTVSL